MTYTHILPGAASLAYSIPTLSKEAKRRLAWFDYYHKHKNVSKTCRYFGISRETFYTWQRRFDPHDLTTLESRSSRPGSTRTWEVTRE